MPRFAPCLLLMYDARSCGMRLSSETVRTGHRCWEMDDKGASRPPPRRRRAPAHRRGPALGGGGCRNF
eukprot:2830820-Prymnesium_polylepis.1